MEIIIATDVLRRAGIKVTIASVDASSTSVRASRSITIAADIQIACVSTHCFDMTALPGGSPAPGTAFEFALTLVALLCGRA